MFVLFYHLLFSQDSTIAAKKFVVGKLLYTICSLKRNLSVMYVYGSKRRLIDWWSMEEPRKKRSKGNYYLATWTSRL